MYDRPMKEEELVLYREYLKRRSTFEPYQYIIGEVEFYGLELKVTKTNKIKFIKAPITSALL